MLTVNLTSLDFFNQKRVALLNDLIAVNQRLMPHVIAVATGCKLGEAMALLLFLYGKDIVDGYVLVYHTKHRDVYFTRRPLKLGLPDTDNLFCSICEEEISLRNELLYDFEFVIKQDITFNL